MNYYSFISHVHAGLREFSNSLCLFYTTVLLWMQVVTASCKAFLKIERFCMLSCDVILEIPDSPASPVWPVCNQRNSDRLLLTMRFTKDMTSSRRYLSYPSTTTFINPFDRCV